ncbi:MAG: FAD-dependent oxidoreductase, partial [Deltaproteobacteria bacterium]
MGRQRFRAAVRYHAVSAPMPPIRVAILGGGPAGLSAGKVLTDHGVALTLFEKNAEVGGMARTIRHGPYRFDLGGHRFYTKNRAVRAFLDELFPDDLLTVARSSKIFFQGRYFDYPLKPMNAFFGMGPWTSVEILFDYLRQKLRPRPPRSRNFEEWVVHAFGRKMFECYFKCYTEKVWGID